MPEKFLTSEQMISLINRGIVFEATHQNGSFYLKIEEYDPFVCAAIHDGHQLRDELQENCLLNDQDRWYEEDPITGEFISSMPIVIIGRDSRYEYDLNRNEDNCIYETAWGKDVWKTPLTNEQKEISLTKHQEFYKVVHALISKLEKQFKSCVVYDIHSYNYKRYDRSLPVFNIGAAQINLQKFNKYLSNWFYELEKIELPNIEKFVAINDIFEGNGYFLTNISKHFKNTLVFATEIKKVYCDELTGEIYPLVIQSLTQQLKKAIINNAFYFAKRETNLKIVKKTKLLSSELNKVVINIDKELYKLVKNFEVLHYINPVNLDQEKKKFFNLKYNYHPEFRYAQLDINPYEFKRKLYNLPVENIKDITIQQMYKDVIKAYSDKIDMLASIGSNKFLYNSLRYYGEPDENDIANANFLIYAIDTSKNNHENISSKEALEFFNNRIEQYGFRYKIQLSGKIVSKAMVINHKQMMVIRKDAMFSELNLNALLHHEIGVHMVTTKNALLQPLKIFSIGMPVNDITQEGLAITSEYYSGYFNVQRLRELAIRVVAVNLMVKGNDFKRSFEVLVNQYGMDETKAFYLVARVFRGGGYTKDYVYLKGFKEIIQSANQGQYLENLFIGKTSIKYINAINELVERKILLPPKYRNTSFQDPQNNDQTLNYLISCIK